MLKFTSINLVEDLQQHEHIEEYRVMFTGLLIPVFDTNRRWDVQDLRAYIANHQYP
jgi:hypothetical protein